MILIVFLSFSLYFLCISNDFHCFPIFFRFHFVFNDFKVRVRVRVRVSVGIVTAASQDWGLGFGPVNGARELRLPLPNSKPQFWRASNGLRGGGANSNHNFQISEF